MHLLSGNLAEAKLLRISLGFVMNEQGCPIVVLSPIATMLIGTATGSGSAIGIALPGCAPQPD